MGVDLCAYIEYPLSVPTGRRTADEFDFGGGRNRELFALMRGPLGIPDQYDEWEHIASYGVPEDSPLFPEFDPKADCCSWMTYHEAVNIMVAAQAVGIDSTILQRIVEKMDELERSGIASRLICWWSY